MQSNVIKATVLALALSVPTLAFAQSDTDKQAAGQQAPAAQGAGMETPQVARTPTVEEMSEQELVGQTVFNDQDEELGTIAGIRDGGATGRDAVIEFGGILGMGKDKVAVPLKDFRMSQDGRLIVSKTEDELEKMEGVTDEEKSD
jgi:hypothetical protein